MDIQVRKTDNSSSAHEIAKLLPDFFDTQGLKDIESESRIHELFGAFEVDRMIGFIIYKEINTETIEIAWMGVSPEVQAKGVGTKLVEESLKAFSLKYKVCEVKTLSELDSYEPYKKTRTFYKKLGFIPIETISPYPGWGDNPCQIFVRFLKNTV